ncbi:protein NRT1/ PTR FAMILY 5.5 [Juglans regia]|nr:protein NRT1/ PTR FAMILY 5.5 [Juglans regia]
MWVLMTYLTDMWKLDITHAAAIVNLFAGAATILPVGIAFLVDAFVGDYCCLLVSSLAFSFGLAIMTVSTLTSKGDTQKFLMFYIALTLNAIGVSGHSVSLASFLERQVQIQTLSNQDDIERKRPRKFKSFLKGDIIVVVLLYVAAVALSYAPWCVRFGIPAAGLMVATLLFVSGSCSYKHARPLGRSPLTTVCRVLVASLYKRSCHSPQDANQLYENQLSPHFVPHTQGLRFLDKAAIIVPTQTLGQQEQNGWELCRVTEVEEVKLLIRMIPLWMTFIMSGVVKSIGDTYFSEQANNMDDKIGKLTVPGLFILQAFYQVSKFVFTELSSKVANKLFQKSSGRCVGPIGVISAMVFSILCCIIAAKVETRRLNVTKSVGLVEKPSEIIPMSMFWLLPQFFFLAAVDGTSEYLCEDLDEVSGYCIARFYRGQVPTSTMIRYLRLFTKAVCGAGIVGSVILADEVSSFSKMGGRPSWFQDTLNRSRLDNYYWTVAVLSFINLVLCILVAIWYTCQHLILMMCDVVVAVKRVVLYFYAPVVSRL